MLAFWNKIFFPFQHNIKKLRNNILKSSLEKTSESTKCLQWNNKPIVWEHFINAFRYDQGEFSMSLHEKLKAEHFYLNPSTKMRNHLAEEVLNQNMLSLMKVSNVNNCKQPCKE